MQSTIVQPKVLITDGVHPLMISELEKRGFSCDYHPNISDADVRKVISCYCGLIVNSKVNVDVAMIDKAEKLKFIGRLGSGMEIIDIPYAREKGIAVFRSPEGNCNAVAEHIIGMLLALQNKLLIGDREVRKEQWNREANRGFEIFGKTIGIIGFGHTGRRFAEKLSGFGVKVLAFDKYKENYVKDMAYVEETDLQSIKKNADIISFHLPLSEETKHMFDADFINGCRPNIIVINSSRGQVVNTLDLIDGLISKKIKGACLDVYENEKPHTFTLEEKKMYNLLYTFDNVVLTPHVAGWTVESKEKLTTILLEKFREVECMI